MKRVFYKTIFLSVCSFLATASNGINSSKACNKNICVKHLVHSKEVKIKVSTTTIESGYPDLILTNAILRF